MTAPAWAELEALFHEALARAPAERAALLAERCAGRPEVQAQIEAMLRTHTEARSALGDPSFAVQPPLKAGVRLGAYAITGPLGVGGMGEVYRARDTRLGREVAIKVLPAAFMADTDRLGRLEREARVLAALNHPNIATIYGIEEGLVEAGHHVRALVMELIEGPTLADRLAQGALPIKEALEIARQIAEALEAAHEKGIVHRDLKPANIKITPAGGVKVLDFGLAKVAPTDAASSHAPTVTMGGTHEGLILGTAPYMSPEQARGQSVDKRTDIWAFGCVTYELLTGKPAFQRETFTDTIAAVLEREPDWHAMPPDTPATLREVLRRCLRKDKDRRLRDIGDARIEIDEILAVVTRTGTSSPTPTEAGASTPRSGVRSRIAGQRTILAGLACVVVAFLASLATWHLKPPTATAPLSVSRFTIALPAGQRLVGLEVPALSLSPDGSFLVYVASANGVRQLYVRAMDDLEAKAIRGTEGAADPFFSPDAQWVGFFAFNKLQKISIKGGTPVTLSSTTSTRGASWSKEATIAFSPGFGSGIRQLSDAGGAEQFLTRPDSGEAAHRWPEFLPGGRALLFAASTTSTNWINAQIALQSVESSERRDLVQGGTYPRYAPTGHLVYAQGGTLMAAPFDPQRLALTGAAVPVLEGVVEDITTGSAQYSFSATGSLVYVQGGIQGARNSLVWVSRNGATEPLATPERGYFAPRMSPDGKLVAVGVEEQDGHVWTYDVTRETLTRATFEGNVNILPTWTPDGKRLVFQSNRAGARNLFWQLTDGSGGLEQLTTSQYNDFPASFSPDGQLLAFVETHPATGYDIWILRLNDLRQTGAERGSAQPFLRTQFNETAPRFSPDGRWLAYASNESGRFEVYVQPYPGPGGKWQVSTEGGMEPVWNANGQELFYRQANKMMSVDVRTQPAFSADKPKMLFEGSYVPNTGSFPNYDVSNDGQRFLMLKPNQQPEQIVTQINVVLNWFQELQRLVPTP